MRILFSESFEMCSKMIFAIYDFDRDGVITSEDIRTVLQYVPLNTRTRNDLLKYERSLFLILVRVLRIE
jgi:Ca2+-binding EF-hand superfamily protein